MHAYYAWILCMHTMHASYARILRMLCILCMHVCRHAESARMDARLRGPGLTIVAFFLSFFCFFNMPQFAAICLNMLHFDSIFFDMLQSVVTCLNVFQCASTCFSMLRYASMCFDALQCAAIRFNTLQSADLMTTIGNVGFQTESSAILNKEATVSNSKHYGNHGTSNGNHRKSKGRQWKTHAIQGWVVSGK